MGIAAAAGPPPGPQDLPGMDRAAGRNFSTVIACQPNIIRFSRLPQGIDSIARCRKVEIEMALEIFS